MNFSNVSTLNFWFTEGGGYVDQFDNWVSTGSYRVYARVWYGKIQNQSCEGYQPGNAITLTMSVQRSGRRWIGYGLNAAYLRGSGVPVSMSGEHTIIARSLNQLNRKALWRWRNYGSLRAVLAATYHPEKRAHVFKLVDDTWTPFASTWHGIGGIESPGTPLGMGDFLIKPVKDKFHQLHVGTYGTGGSYGGNCKKVSDSELWLNPQPA